MGTRNLTIVINRKGETKVGQYGQWDGYPEGAGFIILEFLSRKSNREALEKAIEKTRFMNDEDDKEMGEFLKSIGSDDGWLTGEQSEKYKEKYPYLTRDHGAGILKTITESNDDEILLANQSSFAADSLFCEWAYVIDFQKETFEVYRGFNQEKLDENERFHNIEQEKNENYEPVRFSQSFTFDNLPTYQHFMEKYNNEEEE